MILEKFRYLYQNTCYASAIKSPTAKKFSRNGRPKYSRHGKYWFIHITANLHIQLYWCFWNSFVCVGIVFLPFPFSFSLCLSSCTSFVGENTTVNLYKPMKMYFRHLPFTECDIQRRIWLNRVRLTLTWATHLPRDVAVDAGLLLDKTARWWVIKQDPVLHIWKLVVKIFEDFTVNIQILILHVIRCALWEMSEMFQSNTIEGVKWSQTVPPKHP